MESKVPTTKVLMSVKMPEDIHYDKNTLLYYLQGLMPYLKPLERESDPVFQELFGSLKSSYDNVSLYVHSLENQPMIIGVDPEIASV